MPMITPVFAISLLSISPVEYARECGGVETGRIMPKDAEKATTTSSDCNPPMLASEGIDAPIAAAMGIKRLAVAVFDIKLAISQHTTDNVSTTAIGDSDS